MGLLYYTDEYDPEVCKQLNKPLKVLYVLLLVVIMISIYNATVIIVARNRFKDYIVLTNYSYSQYRESYQELANEFNILEDVHLSRQEIIQLAKKAVPVKFYLFFNIKPYKEGATGGTFLVLRTIVVDPKADDDHYTMALVHELIHLKDFTINETYTQFMTFKTLYESENPYFHKIGVLLALEIFDKRYPKEYTCIGNIIEYLYNNNI